MNIAVASIDLSAITAIAAAALVTYAMRLGGLLLAERLPASPGFQAFMNALPGTILISLVAPGIVAAGWIGGVAAVLTAVTTYRTRNVFAAMVVGMAVIIVYRHLV